MISPAHVADAVLRHPFWVVEWAAVMDPHVLLCGFALFTSGILCSAAGIGGGGIYVVVLMLAGLLSPHDAVPLSKAVVFFGSLSTLALNFKRMGSAAKSSSSETVIDFHTVRVVAPAALGGTFLGVVLNWHSDGYTIVLMLTLILIFMTVTVGRTALQQYRREEDELSRFSSDDALEAEEEAAPLLPPGHNTTPVSKLPMTRCAASYTTQDLVGAASLEVLVILSSALRFHMAACHAEQSGGGVAGSCTHPVAWLFFGDSLGGWMSAPTSAVLLQQLMAFVPLLACLMTSAYCGRETYMHAHWRFSDIVSFQVMAVATGLFAGLVGVGGGLVFSPFFLIMGLDPAAAVATSSTCVLFTSSSTTFQYLLTDRVIMSLALVYGLVTTVASYMGTSLVHTLQDSFKGRRSYVTMIVVVAVALSALLSMVKVYTMLSEPATAPVPVSAAVLANAAVGL